MENAQAHRFRGAPGHCLMGLATSGQWGCFTLFYSLRKPFLLPPIDDARIEGIMGHAPLPRERREENKR